MTSFCLFFVALDANNIISSSKYSIMKKTIKKLQHEGKAIKNVKAVKGGEHRLGPISSGCEQTP